MSHEPAFTLPQPRDVVRSPFERLPIHAAQHLFPCYLFQGPGPGTGYRSGDGGGGGVMTRDGMCGGMRGGTRGCDEGAHMYSKNNKTQH